MHEAAHLDAGPGNMREMSAKEVWHVLSSIRLEMLP